MKEDQIKKKIKDITEKYYKSSDKYIHFKALSEIAQLRLGKIKEGEVYINNSTKITFIDKLGNEFQMQPNNVKNGKWSPYESERVRDPEYHMKQLEKIALSKGGKIKDGEKYINSLTKMTFIDKLGNEFQMEPKIVKNGSWSPYESGNIYNNPEYHIKQLWEIVKLKGGKIKEGEIYKNNSTKMTFIDKIGNEFKMTPANIKSGQWSPYESKKVRDPEYHMKQLEEIVKSKGGKVKKGEKYINANTKMIFIDSLGNEFKMSPTLIKTGSWSPYESGNVSNNPDYHMQKLMKIVESKGGKIKEGEIYKNNSTKMIFIDQLGNEFKMAPANIKSGNWSPYEKNCFEHVCRQIIEQLYDKKFKSSWDIIKRKGKRNLQLDGYCPELKIAFEYQGIQHTTGWGRDVNSLIAIKQRDYEKKQICIEKGILLLEIHYYKKINNVLDIIQQTIKDIKNSYKKNNLTIPEFISNINMEKIKIDFSKINNLTLMYKQLEEIAKLKGGKIKDGEQYIGSGFKMIFIDKSGNEFKITPTKVKSGQWSPYESKNGCNDPEYHMKKLYKIAQSKGGKIKEGEQYVGAKDKMIFIDKSGNEFSMTPDSIKHGAWSPYESKRGCNDPEYHMEKLREIAKLKGGRIKKGEKYTGAKNKITFIDQLGNEFQITPDSVKRGSWSPYESGSVRYDPEYHMKQLRKIVELKGGKIKEGQQYINAKTKMIFIDQLGNEFEMTPHRIKDNRWPQYESDK